MANPINPAVASSPVPPPVLNLPWVTQDQSGQYILTPVAIQFLQTLWASIAGTGGLIDITQLTLTDTGVVQAIALALIDQVAARLPFLVPPPNLAAEREYAREQPFLVPPTNLAAERHHADDIALLLSRPNIPLPVVTTVLNEAPSGTIDGVNTTFTLAHTPSTAGILLFQQGMLKTPTTDYTLSGATITMAIAPLVGNVLLAAYQYT